MFSLTRPLAWTLLPPVLYTLAGLWVAHYRRRTLQATRMATMRHLTTTTQGRLLLLTWYLLMLLLVAFPILTLVLAWITELGSLWLLWALWWVALFYSVTAMTSVGKDDSEYHRLPH